MVGDGGASVKDRVFGYRGARNAAEVAVLHVLQRLQYDANVYREMGPFTESFVRLCAAEAEMTGEPVEVVKERRGRCLDDRESEVQRLRTENKKLESVIEQALWTADLSVLREGRE